MTNSFRGRWTGPVFSCFLLILSLFEVNAETFLVAENPTELQLLNRFEQRFTEREQRFLQPNAPIRVIEKEAFLSDGFTPCIIGEFRGQRVFILTDSIGNILDPIGTAAATYYQNSTALGDTITVLKSERILLREAPIQRPRSGRPFLSADANSTFIRRFSYRNYTLLFNPIDNRYHWTRLPANRKGRDWDTYKPDQSLSMISPALRESLAGIFGEYNQLLSKLYQHFNQIQGQNLTAPNWEVTYLDTLITARFPSELPGNAFQESQRYLVNKLENQLLGVSVDLLVSSDKIEIKPRRQRP